MTTLQYLRQLAIPATYDLLPPQMASDAATAMLIAIALQESDKLRARTQYQGGPARGFWQFEKGGGVVGVLSHPATKTHIERVIETLSYQPIANQCHVAIEHNDILACSFARLLLWTLPAGLPGKDEAQLAYGQYLAAWRPGKPHPSTWAEHFDQGWRCV